MLLKLLGGHFSDVVVKKVKDENVFRGTGDNWDLKILKGHMRKEIQNEDLHLFASNLIENRVCFNHLPNDKPKGDIKQFPRKNFSLNVNEMRRYVDRAKTLVGRIVIEFLPKFKFLKAVVPGHISHEYSEQMSQKSTIVSLPIINANEAKYEDCVAILSTYEKWIAEIYFKAGKLDEAPDMENPPDPQGPAAPGQTDAHRHDTVHDPMHEMKIAFSGDQLTRVRFAGAKDLLASSHTPSDRFEHCSLFTHASPIFCSKNLHLHLYFLRSHLYIYKCFFILRFIIYNIFSQAYIVQTTPCHHTIIFHTTIFI
jgi:hypothetical protein